MIDVARTVEHVVHVLDAAPELREPFHHLRFAGIFPDDVYGALRDAMPDPAQYGRMSGRARGAARTRIDLFPEGLLRVPGGRRVTWSAIGRVLRAAAVREALVRRLAPGLAARFGPGYGAVALYAVPILARDVAGYRIGVHPDTDWKGITVQIYLPRDASIAHVGTIFHRREGSGYRETVRMPFLPNTGYAFAVGSDTYHSVDTVGPEVASRDSIIVNYFVDRSWLQVAQNRGKRIGHLVRGLGWRRAR